LNNHGTIHYLTDSQWGKYVWLNGISGLAFLLAVVVNWFYKPFKPPARHGE
jgi:hypothetical protein